MGKNIIAAVAAFICFLAAVFLIQTVSHQLYPLPMELDPKKPEEFALYMKDAPVGMYIWVLISYALGSVAAGIVLRLMRTNLIAAVIIGIILTALGYFNFLSIPHPDWVVITGLVSFIPFTLLGYVLGAFVRQK